MGTFFFRKGPVKILSRDEEGILLGPTRPGIYRVLVGNKLIDCDESDLTPIGESPDDRRVPTGDRPRKGVKLGKFEAGPMFCTTIDLHGLNVRGALEIIGRKINRALLADASRIKIVHEKSDKLAKALAHYLADLPFVRGFEQDENDARVTWVYLKEGPSPAPETPLPAHVVDSPFLQSLLKKS